MRRITIAALALVAIAATDQDHLREGVKSFRAGNYQAALQAFQQAEQGESPLMAAYNALTSMANAGDLAKMEEKLAAQYATLGSDTALRADAAYNLGTANLEIARQADTQNQLPAHAAELQSAVQWLRRSLLDDPDDPDAKSNLELANKLLEKLKQQQQEQQNQDNQDNKQDQQQDGEQNQGQNKQQQQDQQQQKDQQQNQQQNQQQQQQNQQQKQQEQQEREISEATAKNLLEAARNAEEKAMKMMREQLNRKQQKRAPKGRDW
jgi:Ca-activated chloride channel homolog